ncbi:MAG: 30S ribosomal protein S20 [Candidatus Marinimicrobia bacterium]|nr:30S ribosomal protein S20 [Candidatus Neomarinimicrobiota bacterium]
MAKKSKSVLKRVRQAEKRRLRNKHYKSLIKTMIKKVKSAQTKEEAEELYKKAVSVIDKVASKGIIHKNNAARKKSRLAKYLAKLQ